MQVNLATSYSSQVNQVMRASKDSRIVNIYCVKTTRQDWMLTQYNGWQHLLHGLTCVCQHVSTATDLFTSSCIK